MKLLKHLQPMLNGEKAFILHDVKEEKKVVAIISCIGLKLCNLLNDLSFLKALESLKYTENVAILLKPNP